MFSVAEVSGAASTMKSDSARSSGRPSGPSTRSSIASTSGDASASRAARPTARSAGLRVRAGLGAGLACHAAAPTCRRVAMTRQPNAVASAPTARPIEPSPTMPTVTSRSSAPSSGCHVRSRCSSRSWGSRRLTARIIIRTYSAIGLEKTPRAFVMTSPRSRPAGVRTRSTPADAEWTHARRGARARRRSKASAESQPRSSTSTSSSGPSARPSVETLTIVPPAPRRGSARGRGRGSGPRGSG